MAKASGFTRRDAERILGATDRVERTPAFSGGMMDRSREYPGGSISFRNDSGVAMPAFACFASVGMEDAGGTTTGKQFRHIAKKPTAPDTYYGRQYLYFNSGSVVEVNQTGTAQFGPEFLGIGITTSTWGVVGTIASPVKDQWWLSPSIGAFSNANNDVRGMPSQFEFRGTVAGVLSGISSVGVVVRPLINRVLLVKAPSGGIPKRVGSRVFSANCEIYTTSATQGTVDLMATGVSINVYNYLQKAALDIGDRYGQATLMDDGRWWAFSDDCTAPL